MRALFLLLALCPAAIMPAAAGAPPAYDLTNIGVGSPFDQAVPNSINGVGHITGYGVVPGSGEIHAFIYASGTFQDLGLLGYQASDGIAINRSDQLAADGIGPGSTALFYANGHATRIGSIDGGYTSAYAINNHGDIVGSGVNGDGGIVGFSWINGVFTDLSTMGVYRATNINDSDQFICTTIYSWVHGGFVHTSDHASIYSGGVMTDLGSLTGNPQTNTEAFGLNASGQVVGYSMAADNLEHAFLYSNGVMQDLGTLNGDYAIGIAINNHGLIVGNLMNAYNANLGAFVDADGTMYDLADLIVSGGAGWSQLTVTGLNDNGLIVGYGTVNGGTQGFVATPDLSAGVATGPWAARSGIALAEPNPFHPDTRILFTISPRSALADTRLDIVTTSGRLLRSLLSGRLSSGDHAVVWDGRTAGGDAVAGGVYFARLSTAEGTESRKLVLVK